MGITLTHEHLFSNFGAAINDASSYDEEALLKQVIPYLKKIKRKGIQTIFDCTTAFFGRRVDLLKKIGDSTGINIVTNTGYYAAANDKYIPKHAYEENSKKIAKRWIDEFENGIDGTSIKPGFIKLAFDEGTPSKIDKKLFEAGVITHKKTGLAIAVHTGNNQESIEFQLKTIKKHNATLDALIWVHAQKMKDVKFLINQASKGVWISLDGVTEAKTNEYIILLNNFKINKLLHKVLLSHDGNSFPRGNKIRPYHAISDNLIPAMRNEGFSEKEIHQILILNPMEAFSIKNTSK